MRYVKYIGPSHIRQITARDWRSIGLTGDTVQWSAFNGFAVPLDSFNEDQIRKAIEPDSFLVITGEDEEFEPVYHTRDMTPDQATQTTENPVDVVDIMEGRQIVSRDESGSSTVSAPGGTAPTTTTTSGGSGSDTPR